VGAAAAICVNDDLSARQAAVAVRSADNELAGGIDMIFDFSVKELLYLFAKLHFNPWNEDVDHILFDRFQHLLFVLVKIIMLGGNDYGVHSLRGAVVVIFNCDLAL